MARQNNVLQQILGQIPRTRFNALVTQHKVDWHVSALFTKTMLITLIYTRLAGIARLRETGDVTRAQASRLHPAGIAPVAKSTLSDALAKRPPAVFEQLFACLRARADRRIRRDTTEMVRLIGSTSLMLNSHSKNRAAFSTSVCGAKAHIIHDPDAGCPLYRAVTPVRTNDITAVHEMPIEAGATYVFDLGYYDFAWWNRMHEAGCRIVTRFKSNTSLDARWEKHFDPGLPILSDRIGRLPDRQGNNRCNPFQAEVREVRVRTDTGKILRILTNRLTAPVQEIADLYKRRWQIELLFRWIKQNLKLAKFMGTSWNGVRIQVFTALIAYILARLVYEVHGTPVRMVRFIRGARGNLLERKSLDDIVRDLIPPPRRRRDPVAFHEPAPRKQPKRRLFGNIFGGVGCLEY